MTETSITKNGSSEMNKQDAMQEIETIRARLTVLERIVHEEEKPLGLWRPQLRGSDIFILCSAGSSLQLSPAHIRGQFQFGTIFKTDAEAKKAAPLFARAHKIIQAALQADPDAGEWAEGRIWSIVHEREKWQSYFTAYVSDVVYVHTKAQAEHMAAILNAEGVK